MILVLLGLAPAGRGAELTVSPESQRRGVQFFERKIRPVLIEKCYSCHSKSSGQAEGGLRVDSAEGVRLGGQNGALLVPGVPSKSPLIARLRSGHPETKMPPKVGLARSTITDFETWIKMGAPDPRSGEARQPSAGSHEKHWAFLPIRAPLIPKVQDASWPKEPIDHFVLADLEKANLRPAQSAARADFIRRVSFDLLGLPPKPEEVDEFVADRSPRAMEELVDRLLAAPQFGEHWGRHWLHVAGYADLEGPGLNMVHSNAWRYRDYVIAAFNRDKPYDQFIQEQLAGDLLPEEDDEALAHERLIATGFLMVGHKLGIEPRRAQRILDVADDQIEVTTRAFLGLSVACARCHDHKADPISMREYYALAGIFTSTSSLADPADEPRRGMARWLERSLATLEQLKQVSEYETRFKQLKEQVQEAREMKTAFPGDIDSSTLEGIVVDNLAAELHGAWKESSYSTNFVDRNYVHDADADKGKKSARFVPDLPSDGLYEVLVSYTHRANRATNVPVTITGKDGSKTVFVNQTLPPKIDKVFTPLGKFRFDAGTSGSVAISNEGTRGFVVVDAVRFMPADSATPATGDSAVADPEMALLNYRQLEREFLEFRSQRPVVPHAMAVREGNIQNATVRTGGQLEPLGERVPRGFLSALGTPESTLYAITDESSGRLELAYWIARPDNPLTARVAVNRIWQHLFGKGLVETVDDFGTLGARPSHPELLDHLAQRFVEGGWSVKKLIRGILLSNTYQMSSQPPSGALQRDPANRLLSRMTPRQLEPEVLRDTILVLSGELDQQMGGSWMPSNAPPISASQLARRVQGTSRQRSIYLPVIRESTPDVLRLIQFGADAQGPAGSQTPSAASQNRFLSQAAAAWADRLLQPPARADGPRITLAYRQALGRPPTKTEIEQSLQSLQTMHSPGDPSNTLGWEKLCQSLFTSEALRTVH